MPAAWADIPDAIAAPGEALVATVHAQGAQVYVCVLDPSGKLAWQFREPIATLLVEGKTVGRHYAGPNWELSDGSAVVAKASGRASGATAADIPLLKLEVVSQRGTGASVRRHDDPEAQYQGRRRAGDARQAGCSACRIPPTTPFTGRCGHRRFRTRADAAEDIPEIRHAFYARRKAET